MIDSIGSDRNIHQIRDVNRSDVRRSAFNRALDHVAHELGYIGDLMGQMRTSSEAKTMHGELLLLEKRIAAMTTRAGQLMEELP